MDSIECFKFIPFQAHEVNLEQNVVRVRRNSYWCHCGGLLEPGVDEIPEELIEWMEKL
jgi:hypothetical protein